MDAINEKTIVTNGFRLHMIPTTKYKTIHFVVKFKALLNRETITTRALLPYVLRQGTENYPTERKLQIKLDELYGATLSIDAAKKGNHHIISFRLEVANDKLINETNNRSLIEEAINFLKEVIFAPKTVEQKSFDPQIVEREKKTLQHKIQAIADDKMAYANMRLISEMCAGELYEIPVYGYEKDLGNITATSAYEYYQNMLTEDDLDIYILGDFDQQLLQNTISATFQRDHQPTEHDVELTEGATIRKDVKEVIEKQPVQQAKLHLGYRTNTTFRDEDYAALQVFNGLYGSFPSSKLFINVREKNSLAYYAASRLESHKGLLIVFSGIASEDYEKAREIIELQMEAMKKGDFTEQELSETKGLIMSSLRETLDHPQGTIELLYQQVIANTKLTINVYFERINQVTKEDIIKIAEKIHEDTVYLLTAEEGQTDEENEL